MAGDIFFTDSRAWSSSSNGFIDIVARAITKCREHETLLVKIFSEAEEVRCLSINLCKDHDLQVALTERIHEAAREKLHELREDPVAHPDDIGFVEELVRLAQAHLTKLGDHAV